MLKKILLLILSVLLLGLSIFIVYLNLQSHPNMIYGISFSPQYARYLGLNFQDVYKKLLDDLKFKYIRLALQWDDIENVKGKYDFTDTDWLMDQAAKRGVKVILAVGRKTPRWPECHIPAWAKDMSYEQYSADLLNYIKIAVVRYKNHPALELWQVENEPFLAFGLCKPMSQVDLKQEVVLVKSLDQVHPTMVTDSGELSTWLKTAQVADYFGTTIYRVVWNQYLGYFNYDWLPAIFYRAKLKLIGRSPETAYVAELQAEPWIPSHDIDGVGLKEQFKSMNIDRLKKNMDFAARTGMSRAYLWGVEWWYYLQAKYGDSSFIEQVKMIRKN